MKTVVYSHAKIKYTISEVFIKSSGKVLCLDIGTVWTGIAISDASATFARPLTTIRAHELVHFLKTICTTENIGIVVVGHPITMSGVKSAQTLDVEQRFAQLQKQFPALFWVLWDERLSSKRAASLAHKKTPEEKLKEHARAAAFILDLYLMYRSQNS